MGNDGRDNDAKKAYEGVLNIEQKFGTEKRTGDKVTAFVNRVKSRLKADPFNVEIPENGTVSCVLNKLNNTCQHTKMICVKYKNRSLKPMQRRTSNFFILTHEQQIMLIRF